MSMKRTQSIAESSPTCSRSSPSRYEMNTLAESASPSKNIELLPLSNFIRSIPSKTGPTYRSFNNSRLRECYLKMYLSQLKPKKQHQLSWRQKNGYLRFCVIYKKLSSLVRWNSYSVFRSEQVHRPYRWSNSLLSSWRQLWILARRYRRQRPEWDHICISARSLPFCTYAVSFKEKTNQERFEEQWTLPLQVLSGNLS